LQAESDVMWMWMTMLDIVGPLDVRHCSRCHRIEEALFEVAWLRLTGYTRILVQH